MSARRKHVRAHARDVEVEVDRENGDRVCRVEEIKGGNVIEVSKHINPFSSVRVCNDFFVVAFVFGRFVCCTNSPPPRFLDATTKTNERTGDKTRRRENARADSQPLREHLLRQKRQFYPLHRIRCTTDDDEQNAGRR